MTFEIKEGTGQLFKNAKKLNDNHPNNTGSCKIAGVEYWVSAWTKHDKNGGIYQSLSFKVKESKPSVEIHKPVKPQLAAVGTNFGKTGFDDFEDETFPF